MVWSNFHATGRTVFRPLLASSCLLSLQLKSDTPIRCRCESSSGPENNDSPSRSPATTIRQNEWNDNSFPDLSRHGRDSLLRQFLTKEVYESLRTKSTTSGVKLEDIIKAGVALPRSTDTSSLGVYCGDAESYHTFSQLLHPMVESHHTTKLPFDRPPLLLQRFKTNMDPQHVVQQQLDPTGDYILFTRMRLARSIKGFQFGSCIQRGERRAVEALLRDCVQQWDDNNKGGSTRTTYQSVKDMDNTVHQQLVQRHILFPNPNSTLLAAGLGRDWPDGRGIYCEQERDDDDDDKSWPPRDTPRIVLWVNAPQDHVWIISTEKGGNIQAVFSRLSRTVWRLETALRDRGHCFHEDRILGFLNSSPADIGTALRASVVIKLVRLGRQKGFYDLMHRLKLEAKAQNDQKSGYTGIFDVGNAETLGKTEVQNINTMIQGVGAFCSSVPEF